jgi:hypothetical protein
MTDAPATVEGAARVYRVARRPDVWRWPDWAYAGQDGTFGNRWDDPEGTYRVIYACSERVGAFVETLARFRPAASVVAGLAAVAGADDTLAPGVVPSSWLRERAIGAATLVGTFVDIGHAASLAILNRALAARLVHYRLAELDGAAIRLTAPRRFTQEVSRFVYERTLPDGRPAFAGIVYRSRLGDNLTDWAIFERVGVEIAPDPDAAVEADDPDFRAALRLLGLTLRP